MIKSVLYDKSLNDYFAVNEFVTLGTRVEMTPVTKGALLPRWTNTQFEICKDGYHGYIDANTYQLISFDGMSSIVHTENINNVDQLRNFFSILSATTVTWDIITINLAPGVYKIDFHNYADREWDYALKFEYGQLIIKGNGAIFVGKDDMNFMTVGADANVVMENLTLQSFNHCFYNHGLLLCSNMEFINNTSYKFDIGLGQSGAVIHNYNTAEFQYCKFDGNRALIFAVPNDEAGSILCAEPHSSTYFYHNRYGTFWDDAIFAKRYSSVVMCSLNDCGYAFRWEIGKHSFIHPLASVTMVNDKSGEFFYDNNGFEENPIVFNCRNSAELKYALMDINLNGIRGSEIIINLVNTDYHYTIDEETNFYYDMAVRYRGTFFDNKYSEFQDEACMADHYFLNTGSLIPITINGNGAHLEISNNKEKLSNHFAFVGKNARLTLNNLRLSRFNTAFINTFGNLVCNNCEFSFNRIDFSWPDDGDFGGVIRSYGGTNIFNNCTFYGNKASHDSHTFYAVEGSYLEVNNCTFYKDEHAIIEGSTIKCPHDFFEKHVTSSSSNYISPDGEGDLIKYVINNTNQFYNIDFSKNTGGI